MIADNRNGNGRRQIRRRWWRPYEGHNRSPRVASVSFDTATEHANNAKRWNCSRTSNYKHILSILIWVITDSSKTTESIRDRAKGRHRFFYVLVVLENITLLLGGGRDFACVGAAQCSRGICSYQHCYSLARHRYASQSPRRHLIHEVRRLILSRRLAWINYRVNVVNLNNTELEGNANIFSVAGTLSLNRA